MKDSNKIVNLYEQIPKEFTDSMNYKNPSKDFPLKHPFRLLISGGSGTGKSNVAINIVKMSKAFDEIWIIAKDVSEALYKYLATNKKFKIFDSMDDVPPLDEMNSKKQKLLIFDDMITESNKVLDKIAEYFVRGRKKNTSCIFITQSYFDVPTLLRKNLTHLLLMKLSDDGDLKRILRVYKFGSDSKEYEKKIYKIYSDATSKDFGFFVIDLVNPKNRYWDNFEFFYNVK